MEKKNKNYQITFEAVKRALVHDQTALVDFLLQNDSDGVIQDDVALLNYAHYEATLSDGKFVGSFREIAKRTIQVEDQLEALQNTCNQVRAGTSKFPIQEESLLQEINRLEEDLSKLEDANCIERDVKEWWLISYWLAKKLEAKKEVILWALNSQWWGRITNNPLEEDEVILELCCISEEE